MAQLLKPSVMSVAFKNLMEEANKQMKGMENEELVFKDKQAVCVQIKLDGKHLGTERLFGINCDVEFTCFIKAVDLSDCEKCKGTGEFFNGPCPVCKE